MTNDIRVNGKAPVLQVITVVAQFLLLPLLWLIYQMYTDLGIMKLQMARVEVRLELQGQRDELEREIKELQETLSDHREKSTYDKKPK
jgi:type III secretory pathway component EscU